MEKVLISIPDALAIRMRTTIPTRYRSKVISELITQEVEKREKALYDCAVAVEKDQLLNDEMQDWEITSEDGLDHNESW